VGRLGFRDGVSASYSYFRRVIILISCTRPPCG